MVSYRTPEFKFDLAEALEVADGEFGQHHRNPVPAAFAVLDLGLSCNTVNSFCNLLFSINL